MINVYDRLGSLFGLPVKNVFEQTEFKKAADETINNQNTSDAENARKETMNGSGSAYSGTSADLQQPTVNSQAPQTKSLYSRIRSARGNTDGGVSDYIIGDRAGDMSDRRQLLLASKLGLGGSRSGNTHSSYAPASASGDGNALVSNAKKYLGVPYKWGGNSPEDGGMDCSGYMVKVYKETAGIDLPRTTYEQVKQGQAIDRANLQPGDLVFFGTADDVHHVGMYIGNGQYIHEPRTGDVAKISNMSDRSDYYAARRYV